MAERSATLLSRPRIAVETPHARGLSHSEQTAAKSHRVRPGCATPTSYSVANATLRARAAAVSRDGDRQVGLAGARTADENDIALVDEIETDDLHRVRRERSQPFLFNQISGSSF